MQFQTIPVSDNFPKNQLILNLKPFKGVLHLANNASEMGKHAIANQCNYNGKSFFHLAQFAFSLSQLPLLIMTALYYFSF